MLTSGFIKTLFAYSFLGNILLPYLFSEKEMFCFFFLEKTNLMVTEILHEKSFTKRALMFFWLIEIPRNFFEMLCLSSCSNERITYKKNKIKRMVERLSLLILSLSLWGIQQEDYYERLLIIEENVSVKDFERVIDAAFGTGTVCEVRKIMSESSRMPSKNDCFLNQVLKRIKRVLSELDLCDRMDDKMPNFQNKIAYCNWKLLNAQYVSVDMLNKYNKYSRES